jgi:hypothetical protein
METKKRRNRVFDGAEPKKAPFAIKKAPLSGVLEETCREAASPFRIVYANKKTPVGGSFVGVPGGTCHFAA